MSYVKAIDNSRSYGILAGEFVSADELLCPVLALLVYDVTLGLPGCLISCRAASRSEARFLLFRELNAFA
jgi:hypothetical protein